MTPPFGPECLTSLADDMTPLCPLLTSTLRSDRLTAPSVAEATQSRSPGVISVAFRAPSPGLRQKGHIRSCRRFAAFLKRSPDTATAEDVRLFQLHLAETGLNICNRNRIMTGLRFLFRVTLRRLDLAAAIYHIREPQKIPLVMSPDETRRLLAVATSLKARVLLSLSYGCGLRGGEVIRLKVKDIDRAQNIIRVEQSKGRKDRHVMLSPEMLALLRPWWKVRPSRYDAGISLQERWLFPGIRAGKPMTTRQLNRLFHEAAAAALAPPGRRCGC